MEMVGLGILVVCIMHIAYAQERMEIDYSQLDKTFYHASGSNVIYADHGKHLVLGCMLPSSWKNEEQFSTRIKWRKDEAYEICGNPRFTTPCEWFDSINHKFQRGAQKLELNLKENDDPSNHMLGTGTYTCYYDDNNTKLEEASVKVFVMSGFEIKVDNDIFQNKTYQLPTDDRSFNLECLIGGVVSKKAPSKKFKWYRDTKLIEASKKYAFYDNGGKLEIKNANSNDAGVYMCEADETDSNGKSPKKMSQYVILQGAGVNSASALNAFMHLILPILSIIVVIRI